MVYDIEDKKKEENINQAFIEKITELGTETIKNEWFLVELVNHFICAYNSEYQYNKTYIRSFKEPFYNFVNQYQRKQTFFLYFSKALSKILRSDEYATIGFDEYAFIKEISKGTEISQKLIQLRNRIPEEMTKYENTKIYIDCTIYKTKTDKIRHYAEEIQMKNENNIDLTEKEIMDKVKHFYNKMKV